MNKIIKNIYWGLLYFYCCSLFTMELSTEQATDEFIKKIYDRTLQYPQLYQLTPLKKKLIPNKKGFSWNICIHQISHNYLFNLKEKFLSLDQTTQKNILDTITNQAYFYAKVGYFFIDETSLINRINPILTQNKPTLPIINKYYNSFAQKINHITPRKYRDSMDLFLSNIQSISIETDNKKYYFSHDITTFLHQEINDYLYPYIILQFALLPKDSQYKIKTTENCDIPVSDFLNALKLLTTIETLRHKDQMIISTRKSLKFMDDYSSIQDDQILTKLGISLQNNNDTVSVLNLINNFFVKNFSEIKTEFNNLNEYLQKIIKENEYLSPIVTFIGLTEHELKKLIFTAEDIDKIKKFQANQILLKMPQPITTTTEKRQNNLKEINQLTNEYISNHLQTKTLYDLFTQAYTPYTIITLHEPSSCGRNGSLKIPTKALKPKALAKINLLYKAQSCDYLTKTELHELKDVINCFSEIEQYRLWEYFFTYYVAPCGGSNNFQPKFSYREGIIPIQEKLINIGTAIFNIRLIFSQVFFLVLFSSIGCSYLAFSTYFFDNFIVHTTLSLLSTLSFFIIIERLASYQWKTHSIDHSKGETIEQFLSDKYEIAEKNQK